MTDIEISSRPERTASPRDLEDVGLPPIQTIGTTSTPAIPPIHAVDVAPRWNESRTTVWRLSATCWCALLMGANDAAYGAIIAYLELYYRKSYTVISLVFLSPFAGYTISALLSNWVHHRCGRRGVAILGAGCHLLAFTVISFHPPFPVLVIMYILVGVGSGIYNAAWNVWIGNMANAHEVLGIFHGFYGLGATTSPLIATSLITKAGWNWYSVYYLLAGAAAIELIYTTTAFWRETGTDYRRDNSSTTTTTGSLSQTRLSLSYRVTWICAIFLFLYGGIEVTIGGWIVVFMTTVRHGSAFASGMTETGFWLGITTGRFVLGFVSPRVGEKLSIAGYLIVAIALELIFWLVPQFIVSALAVSLVGFFLGTIFPGVVVLSTRLLPRSVHVAAIGFAAAFSMGGGAVFPFVIGAVAQAKGVTVLQPILLAMLAVALGSLLCIPIESLL
ncbi:MFS transporter [Aspergillus saccharolyticus JOP 1030-1]|uniref:MFS general substrate transporter n=1 Tax=Aspergillus saccharolyticus JOP 1030-1 TaxID=1450539 RepID=A0A319A1R7_9EURO|nr:MFS general substrate transporter [Aspergillus saccharolyticus JOP 1030-1]PYH46228.1 MFS general substrate transporter [Aspergillus saccharolyticus JOP 1030-1]